MHADVDVTYDMLL